MQNEKLALAIGEVSWQKFKTMLEYKAEWYGKNILYIGRFQPSSKLCSHCGKIFKELSLKDRSWTCQSCGFFENLSAMWTQLFTLFTFSFATSHVFVLLPLFANWNRKAQLQFGSCTKAYCQRTFWKEHTFWSDGYFVCSIGEASPETVRQYILSQG